MKIIEKSMNTIETSIIIIEESVHAHTGERSLKQSDGRNLCKSQPVVHSRILKKIGPPGPIFFKILLFTTFLLRLPDWALGLARALAPWPGPGPHNCCKWGTRALALGHLNLKI